jgi:hypothetical protein
LSDRGNFEVPYLIAEKLRSDRDATPVAAEPPEATLQ